MLSGTLFQLTSQAGIGANQWRIMDSATAQADNAASKANFETSATVRYIQITPGQDVTTPVASPGPPADTANGPGWIFTLADFDVPLADRPGERRLPTGNITFNCVFVGSVADVATNFGIHVKLFRRESGGTYTFLGKAETVGLSISVTAADVDVPVNLASVTYFPLGSSLHAEVWIKGRGTAIVGQKVTFKLGKGVVAQQDTTVSMAGVGLHTEYDRVRPPVVAVGVSTRQPHFIRLSSKQAAMVGVPALARFADLKRAMPVTMVGLASRRLYVKPGPKVATMVGVASMFKTFKFGSPFSATMVGIASPITRWVRLGAKSATMVGIASKGPTTVGIRRAATMIGVPTLVRVLDLRRALAVVMTGVVTGYVKIPFGKVPGEGGAPPTIVKKIISIFDD